MKTGLDRSTFEALGIVALVRVRQVAQAGILLPLGETHALDWWTRRRARACPETITHAQQMPAMHKTNTKHALHHVCTALQRVRSALGARRRPDAGRGDRFGGVLQGRFLHAKTTKKVVSSRGGQR